MIRVKFFRSQLKICQKRDEQDLKAILSNNNQKKEIRASTNGAKCKITKSQILLIRISLVYFNRISSIYANKKKAANKLKKLTK